MTIPSTLSNVTVPLSLEPHHQAEQFRKHQPSPQKAKQVYLNTLAIYATRFYLECLGYEPDLAASDGLNPVQQMLLGTAALAVKGYGQLECLPVVGEVSEVAIAPELHQDRLGYVVVHLDDSLRTATLLGVVTQPATQIALDQLQSLDILSELLIPTVLQQAGEQMTQLSRWLQNLADEGWQVLDSMAIPRTLAFRNQAAAVNEDLITRSKRISLNNQEITLTVGLLPLSDTQTEIQVHVHGAETESYLPPQLKLGVLDSNNQEVMQAEARATEAIQLKFTGHPGEEFSLRLTLQDTSFAERFVI
ncbi:MAG: DUF1822 family protein [Cyanobacteria bacterium P01_D01_bin.156]